MDAFAFWTLRASCAKKWRAINSNVGQRAYAVLDLRAAFGINPSWEVALSVNNVLDKRYYLSQHTPAMNVWYGDPRNFMLRIDANF